MTVLDLPDVPRWVEAHGIASDPAGWLRPLGGGFAVGQDQARLIVVAGEADPDQASILASAFPRHTLLIAIERDDLAATLRRSGRTIERAILHTLHEADALPDLEGAMALPHDASLAHLRPDLADELAAVRATRTIWSSWIHGEPVSFAYAPWRSTGWFDVSVDTIPGARQLGLGAITAAAMIRDERAQGREPVWGADEHNAGSLRLARQLGFTAIDELWIVPGAR